MDMPGGWDDVVEVDAGAPSQPPPPSIGTWECDLLINPETTITCVKVPVYDKDKPVAGTKPARELLMATLKAQNNDKLGLNYRGELEKDKVTPDPYYKVAPHFSTLGWSTVASGTKPEILATPADMCERVTKAAKSVPFIKECPIYVVNKDGKRRITLEEAKVAYTTVKSVPNIYHKTPSAMERIAALEAEVATLRNSLSETTRIVEELQAKLKASAEPHTAVGEKRARSA